MTTAEFLAEAEAELVRAERMLSALDENIAQCRAWLERSELMRAEAIKLRDSLRVAVGKMRHVPSAQVSGTVVQAETEAGPDA